ncbi:MAG: tRNA epoxyqueuosine(34) reductase QueG [Phycisphaerae bacterium]
MSVADKTRLIKQVAAGHGFDRVGIAEARTVPRVPYLNQWLATGRAGTMRYLHRNLNIRSDPRQLLDGARSVIVLAFNYHQQAPPPPDDGLPRGRVAMYAWGDDYHVIVKKRLHALADELHQQIDEPFETRCCVDTVPILERELAAAAGIGWIGKNTMVLHPDLGSYFFLGEIVTTLELSPDEPVTDHCGTCTRCLEACPTKAFTAPYQMDASQCISYLTIEHRDEIPLDFHEAIGEWVFGCDLCQQVCPYNQSAPISRSFPIRPPGPRPHLDEMCKWSDGDYRGILKTSTIRRAKLSMLQRNATIARRNVQ